MANIQINNTNYYYELHGQGPVLILIAGYTCDHFFWGTVLDNLSKKFQVLILDNRAIGQTVDNNERLTAELMANDIMELANRLSLKNPTIIGHSMGGTIAQYIGANHGHTINKLVLLHTTNKWRPAMLDGLKSLLLLRQKNVDFDAIFSATIPWIFGETFLTNKEQVTSLKQAMLDNPYPQSLENQLRQFEVLTNFDGRNLGQHIKVPTLVGYGHEDIVCLPHEAERLAQSIKGSELVCFSGAHGVTLDAPDELVKKLIEFLN